MRVNKIYLILILILFTPLTSNADFNWKKIGKNTDGSVFFVEKSSIKKVRNVRYFYLLTDYSKPHLNVLSAKNYIEGNCNKSKYRFLKDIYYAEPMGNGDIIETISETGDWTSYDDGQIMGVIMKYVCEF
tara:strand:- start:79 stop:468 length:390 start_codon:yes stop_codon:yes gene_type:complete